jgi:hypothetical protein
MSIEQGVVEPRGPALDLYHQETVTDAGLDPLYARSVGAAMLGAFVGEQKYGKEAKAGLQHDLTAMIDESPHYQGEHEGDQELLAKKLLRFRPRLVGAVGAYSHLTGQRYNQIVGQGGLENFYLFWALGSIQDDFIDGLPKQLPAEGEDPGEAHDRRRALVAQSIFGDDRRFYRAAHHMLRARIKGSDLGEHQTNYALDKVTDWYQFLIDQEAHVLATPFDELDFETSRTYREDQNRRAGTTLVALLNGRNNLDPRYRAVEDPVAEFSFMTQIIDDIADTAEDLSARRPSYAVGALVDNPRDMARMEAYMAANPNAKITPGQFKLVAPEAYDQVYGAFTDYADSLRTSASKGIATLGTRMFRYFPHIRNALFRIDPKYANF